MLPMNYVHRSRLRALRVSRFAIRFVIRCPLSSHVNAIKWRSSPHLPPMTHMRKSQSKTKHVTASASSNQIFNATTRVSSEIERSEFGFAGGQNFSTRKDSLRILVRESSGSIPNRLDDQRHQVVNAIESDRRVGILKSVQLSSKSQKPSLDWGAGMQREWWVLAFFGARLAKFSLIIGIMRAGISWYILMRLRATQLHMLKLERYCSTQDTE
jgi:hypothetical protein